MAHAADAAFSAPVITADIALSHQSVGPTTTDTAVTVIGVNGFRRIG